ncbi:MAG: hypothetical protein KA072_00545 [Thermoanaerobaculaceae bacterium]|nr:hypothetical protein [Thermoanaerobaculaceae bacterium]MDI9621259.1 hypothetical protein [Acidobacteriota bacterium]NLH11920.1 hypothetical protein [Holophagae bacterium]HPW54209.1 hypothetical protein [Thermoanaerobaculaceae bacterium]
MVKPFVVALVLATLAASTLAQEMEEETFPIAPGKVQRVVIVNQPRTYTVQGEVSVAGPIRQGSMVALRDVLVPPVGKGDTTRLVNAGTISTDGFVSMVVGVAGQIKDQMVKAGEVGAFLVPDDELTQRALEEHGQLLFAIEVKASTGSGTAPYFASSQARATVAFPRYRVLLFNTSDKTAAVNVYAYLSS